MRIFIDIGHPAHVHYFRNFIRIMEARHHEFLITARKKEVTLDLLSKYHIAYQNRGSGRTGLLGKVLYLYEADKFLYRLAKNFKPDIFLSFGSSYAAHVSKIFKKPHLAFDDTEHAKLEHLMYVPFTDVILTPACFLKNFGKKHIRFDGYMELCALHPNYFHPDISILDTLGVKKNEKYVIFRFVSWQASHDMGHQRLAGQAKTELISSLSRYARIFITSEAELAPEFDQYQIPVSADRLHHALAFASLYVGEGLTTASECAVLGVPNILVNSILNKKTAPGVNLELQQRGLQYLFSSPEGVMEKSIALLQNPQSRSDFLQKRQALLSDKIDVTAFMAWFVEDYPVSFEVIKGNPEYQNRFKTTAAI